MATGFVVRSREHGDGSEFDSDISTRAILPDHYVKRLWSKRVLTADHSISITFANKDEVDEGTMYSAFERHGVMHVKQRVQRESSPEIARVQWAPGKGKALEKSVFTLDNKTGAIKDLLWKSKHFDLLSGPSNSRVFTGPDGLEYKWKHIVAGANPAFPDLIYWTLYCKDSQHPIATTEPLADRDFISSPTRHAYPLYVSERGVSILNWIIPTLLIADRITDV